MILLYLFLTFLLVGTFSFGGGMSMMSLIEQITVSWMKWLDEETLYRFVGIAESTPGPIAVNIATFIGYSQGNFLGALLATLGVIIPSFIIILVIACFFDKFQDNKYVKIIINGIKPVIVGLIFAMAIKIFFINVFTYFNVNKTMVFEYKPLIIIGILMSVYYFAFFVFKKKVSPFILIIFSGVLGIVFYL